MERSLDLSNDALEQLFKKTVELLLRQYETLGSQKGYHDFDQKVVENWFREPLPLEGMDDYDLLDFVEDKVVNTATGNFGPNMYAYVMSGGNQIATIAELIANTIDQNATKWHLAPAMSEIEKQVMRWTAEMLGYHTEAGGVMVSGGSAANLTGLTIARNMFLEKHGVKSKGLFGMKPIVVYTSRQAHSCIEKSIQLLGIGTDYLRKIKTNEAFQIDLDELKTQIERDIDQGLVPFCIVGTSGTVNTGAIDDLDALANIAEKYEMWFHIDGAYGALASVVEPLRQYYKGIERADSIALDFHKWLYQPFEAGCTLVKSWEMMRKTYFKKADYLDTTLEEDNKRLDYNEHYFQLSRNAKAFKVWMSIKSYGFERLRAMIQKDIDLTHYLADRINVSEDFVLKATSHLAIACFQFTGQLQEAKDIEKLNQALIPELEKDGRVFITGTKLEGEFVLRACLINHRKTRESTDFLLHVIREVGLTIIDGSK